MHRMQCTLRAVQVQFLASSLVLALLALPGWGSQPSWSHTWGGLSFDQAQSVALDANGNVYVAGSTSSYGAGEDALILKYSASGSLRWAKTWGGSSDDYATRIAIGPDGYIYVVGSTSSYGVGSRSMFLLKLTSNGDLKWGLTWGGGNYEEGHDLGFDQAGNIYVTVDSRSNGNSAVILKFSPSGGSPIWSTSWKGPATYDIPFWLTVDSNFNVIIGGQSLDNSGQYPHSSLLLVKYDSTGNYMWSENWATAIPGQDQPEPYHGLTTDGSGNIYVGAGHSGNCPYPDFNGCDFQALVLNIDASGNFRWAETWGGSGFDTVGGIGLDPDGHLLASGIKGNYTANPMLFVLSYDTTGGLLSSAGWSGQQAPPAPWSAITVDGVGNAWVAGGARNNSGAWVPIAGSVRSRPNSLVTNPYSLGTPIGEVTSLTSPTVSQTGVTDTGGGGIDAFVARYPHRLSGGSPLNLPR